MALLGLDAALAGLKVSQQQISVISNNIANVSTDGFTRKTISQSAQSIQGVTVGVLTDTIVRKVDLNLARDLWTQVSGASFYAVKENYLNRVQDFHGPPDQELSVAAKISDLKDAFAALSDSPEDNSLQTTALNAASTVANKINDFAKLLNTMRNDTQTDIQTAVADANNLLKQIASVNSEIASNNSIGRSTAVLEDTRDSAVKKLSEYMDISFFTRNDGVMVVQTKAGTQLAASSAFQLTFRPAALGSNSAYPASAAALYVGDPSVVPNVSQDITQDLGGKIGGLFSLRDDIIPKQQAQLDELAQKLATRFDSQGLRLFTDAAGNIPSDTAPDTATPIPVSYVGFSNQIRVNQAILDDRTLLQKGTVPTDAPVQSGSNEVIRRVVDFAFGTVSYQQASGNVDVRSTTNGAADLQTWLGVFSSASVSGLRNLGTPNYTDIAGLVSSANGALDDPKDQFQITFSESRAGLGPTTITVDLSAAAAAFPIGGSITDAADQIVAQINAQITAAGTPAGLAASASRGTNGQIVLSSRGNINVNASFGANGMGTTGLEYLGLSNGTTTTLDPYFDVKVGSGTTTRVTLEPGDDETDLLNKLNLLGGSDSVGVAGLGAGIDGTTGFLTVRPGDSTNPSAAAFGGDLTILSGAFKTDGSGGSGIPAGVNIASALFGSYTAGPPVQNISPVTDVAYGSAVSTTDSSSAAFRTQYLGPLANVSTDLTGATSLVDYAQKMVSQQSQEVTNASSNKADQQTLRDTLQTQLSSETGVNLDEELSQLIVYQTAFSASARVINAVNQLFEGLLSVF